jgi:hypothetical protein
MATIKCNAAGKILTKNEKVSCGCCGQHCCMYPAQAFFDSLYTFDDLPDVVDYTDIFSSFSLNKLTNPEPYSGGLKYYQGQSEDAFIWLMPDAIDDGNAAWASGPGTGGFSGSRCLIFGEPGVTVSISDQFADTYMVSYEGASATVTRQSLCTWTGETIDEEGTTVRWRLDYVSMNNPEAPANYKWLVSIQGLTTIGGIKIPPQNSPVGTYGLAGITVS